MHLMIQFIAFQFEYSHTQDTKSGQGVGHRPEGGHDHQAEYDVLVMHAGGT